MRKELELMETIEKYLKNNLTETEKATFEKQLQNDPELQKEVQLQKDLMQGIRRVAIKQSVQQGIRKYKFNRNFRTGGIAGLVIAVVVSAAFYFGGKNVSATRSIGNGNVTVTQTSSIPVTDSVIEHPEDPAQKEAAVVPKMSLRAKDSATVFNKLLTTKNLRTQKFQINTNRDTVLKSEGGMSLKIDKNSFVNKKGELLKGAVNIELQEALTPYQIVMANLVTKSDDQLLESGGMFNITASANNEAVKLADKKAIKAAVPTKSLNNKMQLYAGKQQGGKINWINPVPIFNDRGFVSEAIVPVKKGQHDTIATKAPVSAHDEVISSDVAWTVNGKPAGDNLISVSGVIFPAYNGLNYIFSIKELGWANIDCLAGDSRTKEVKMITRVENPADFNYVQTSIIFPNKRMFIQGFKKLDGTYSFTHGEFEPVIHFPVGETAIVMATSCKGDKTYLATQKIKITNEQEIVLKLKEVTMDELKKTITDQTGFAAASAPK